MHRGNAFNGLDLAQSLSYFAETLVELTEKFISDGKVRDEGKNNNPYATKSGREAIKKKKIAENTSIAKQQRIMKYTKRLETWLYLN